MRVKKIIHLDIDAFFAAVEQRDNPHLKNKPVIVGGVSSGRGVVSTASYEARSFGIHSGMPTYRAKKLCPHGYFVEPNFDKYQQTSNTVYDIFYSYTDTVEAAGLDEAYLDVTVNKKGIPSATWIAQDIRYDVYKQTGLTISAGISSNKLISKIASDFCKPNNFLTIPPENAQAFLADLPVRKIPGIGPVTESNCFRYNIRKISDFLKIDFGILSAWFGTSAEYFVTCALGIDTRELSTENVPKSYSIEDTLPHDIVGVEPAKEILCDLSNRLVKKLRLDNIFGKTITLKVKYHDFQSITRRLTLEAPTQDFQTIFDTACSLLNTTEITTTPVRLLGIGVTQLFFYDQDELPPFQPKLFD